MSFDGFVKKAYAADSNAPKTSGCMTIFGPIQNLNLDRYPHALLWMQKTARIGQQFQKLFPFLFPKSLNVVPSSSSLGVGEQSVV